LQGVITSWNNHHERVVHYITRSSDLSHLKTQLAEWFVDYKKTEIVALEDEKKMQPSFVFLLLIFTYTNFVLLQRKPKDLQLSEVILSLASNGAFFLGI
jgi:hypothetical protein